MSWLYSARTLVILAALLLAVFSCSDNNGTVDTDQTEPGIVWTLRSTGFAGDLIDVTWSDAHQMFVAVGDGGLIMTSSDGIVWSEQNSPTNEVLLEVEATSTDFVAVGDNSVILRSADGFNWTEVTPDSVDFGGRWLNGLAVSSDERVVTVGQNGYIYWSDDLNEWHLADTIPLLLDLYGVTWSEENSEFVAVGAVGTRLTSSNGNAWFNEGVTVTTAWLYDIVWSSRLSMYITVGQDGMIMTSPDAGTWTERESRLGNYLYSVAVSNDRIVVVGQDGLIMTSEDAVTWTLRENGLAGNLRATIWNEDNGRFVAVGLAQTAFTSEDGIDWVSRLNGANIDLFDVTCRMGADTLCLAVGSDGTILSSNNGLEWMLMRSGGNSALRSITYRSAPDAMFITVGDNGTVLTSINDGQSWDTTTATINHLYDVASSSNVIVAVGRSGTIMTSPDADLWTKVPNLNTSEHFRAVAFSGNLFVAVGDSGLVAIASDATTPDWALTRIPEKPFLKGIAWIDTMFVAVGSGGDIFTSVDGNSWDRQLWDVPSEDHKQLNDVTYSGSLMIAVGQELTLLSSSDGLEWVGRGQSGTGSIEGVTWNGTRFIAVGETNRLLTSP